MVSSENFTSLPRQKETLATNAYHLHLFLSFLTGNETIRVNNFSLTTDGCNSETGVRSLRRERPKYRQHLSLRSASYAESNFTDPPVGLTCSHHHVPTCISVCITGLGSCVSTLRKWFILQIYKTNRFYRRTIPSYNTNAFDIVLLPKWRTARTAKEHPRRWATRLEEREGVLCTVIAFCETRIRAFRVATRAL